jgi:hypothetical protein
VNGEGVLVFLSRFLMTYPAIIVSLLISKTFPALMTDLQAWFSPDLPLKLNNKAAAPSIDNSMAWGWE